MSDTSARASVSMPIGWYGMAILSWGFFGWGFWQGMLGFLIWPYYVGEWLAMLL